MSDLRILRLPEVKDMTGLSTSTIWRKEKEGSFPKRISLGPRSIGWLLKEVEEWIKSLLN